MSLGGSYSATFLLPDQVHLAYDHQVQDQDAPVLGFASSDSETLISDKGKPGKPDSAHEQDIEHCLDVYGYSKKPAAHTPDSPSLDAGLIKAYERLSQLLFALHRVQDTFSGGNPHNASENRRAIENTFSLVSSLCDVVRDLVQGKSIYPDVTISPCLLLAVSVVSIVVDIYQRSLDNFQDACAPPDSPSDTSSAGSPSSSFTPAYQPEYHTHTRLRRLSDAIAMDFHLEQLQGVLARAHTVTDTSNQTRSRLAQTRQGFQAWIEKWRIPM